MKHTTDIASVFAVFAGRPVSAREESNDVHWSGVTQTVNSLTIASTDPVATDLQAQAAKYGLSVCFRSSQERPVDSYDAERLNVYIEKKDNNRYVVGTHFHVG